MPICIKCKTKSTRVTYHSFPDNDEEKKKWTDVLKIDKNRIKKDSKLCSRHFSEDCFTTDADGKILMEGSIPSVEAFERLKNRKLSAGVSKKKCILCGNNSADLSYFPIPKDEETKLKWEKFCEFELINANYCLCHLHFKPSVWIMENNKRKLLPNALPTIFFDDYQFEFIPVRKSNDVDNSNDTETIIVEPTVFNSNNNGSSESNRNPGEECVISVDYSEYNTPPRTPTCTTSALSEMTVRNGVSDDIVNIFIPTYEGDSRQISEDNSTMNNGTVPKLSVQRIRVCENDVQTSTLNDTQVPTPVPANKGSVAVFGPNGRKKRICYPGDIKSENITSLEVAKFSIDTLRGAITKKNRSIRVLSDKVRRLQAKNAILKETISQMKAEKEAKEKEDLFEVKGWWDS